jgi:hypothetical protein
VVIVRLTIPTKLTEDQRSLLEEYAKSEHVPVFEGETSFWGKIKDVVTGSKSHND